jgi:hypothetical protein
MMSNAPLRASLNAQYAGFKADSDKVYGQAKTEVTNRNPGILAGYQKGTDDLRSNVAKRNTDAAAANTKRDADMTSAAERMGLDPSQAPAINGTSADAIDAQAAAQYTTNADAWAGFNTGAGQRAVERNNSVGDAFSWANTQQQSILQKQLAEALAAAVDVPISGGGGGGGGGRRGGGGGGGSLTAYQQLGGWRALMDASDKDFDNDLNAAKFNQGTQQRPLRSGQTKGRSSGKTYTTR